jgi:hypothetical protein
MVVPFRSFAAAAGGVIDIIFGEPFTAVPMQFVGGKWSQDPIRTPLTINGNLIQQPAFDDAIGHHGQRAARNIVAEHATTHSQIEILESSLPYSLKAKDRFERLSDGTLWEIQGVQSYDLDHISFRITIMGQSS